MDKIGISLKCVFALIAAIVCAGLSIGALVSGPVTASKSQIVTDERSMPFVRTYDLDQVRDLTTDGTFRFLGNVSGQYGLIEIGNSRGFVVEGSTARGNIGLVLVETTQQYDQLVGILARTKGLEPNWITVRLRPELSRRASVLMRPFAPGRPVYVMEPVARPAVEQASGRTNGSIWFAALSIFFGVLFVGFRYFEINSASNKYKHIGEDQPWRTDVSPWSKTGSEQPQNHSRHD